MTAETLRQAIFKKENQFLSVSRAVVLVKTFPLMYQLLM